MPVNRTFEELQARISELLEASPARDVERNVKALLAGAFSRLNLVTREEFDIQVKLLARTHQKLAALEARVASLEARLEKRAETPPSAEPGTPA